MCAERETANENNMSSKFERATDSVPVPRLTLKIRPMKRVTLITKVRILSVQVYQ